MLSLSATILIIEQTQKSFRLSRLIAVISFVHFNGVCDRIFFSRDTFRLISIHIPEIISIIHKHIIRDILLG